MGAATDARRATTRDEPAGSVAPSYQEETRVERYDVAILGGGLAGLNSVYS